MDFGINTELLTEEQLRKLLQLNVHVKKLNMQAWY